MTSWIASRLSKNKRILLSKLTTLNSIINYLPFINRLVRKIHDELQTDNRQLRDSFMDMDMLRYPAQSVDALIRGLITDYAEKVDMTFVDDVS